MDLVEALHKLIQHDSTLTHYEAEVVGRAAAALEKCRIAIGRVEAQRVSREEPCSHCLRTYHTTDCAWVEALEATR